VIKAQYTEKNEYLALNKPGALLFDLIPVVENGVCCFSISKKALMG
jgi:hypothetical protein